MDLKTGTTHFSQSTEKLKTVEKAITTSTSRHKALVSCPIQAVSAVCDPFLVRCLRCELHITVIRNCCFDLFIYFCQFKSIAEMIPI